MERPSVFSRMKKAWNVFVGRDPIRDSSYHGFSSSYNPYRYRLSRGNERSIITSIYNRISIDSAQTDIKHVLLDEKERYSKTIKDGLNTCLTEEANIDQTGRAFKQDMFLSLLDEGSIAIVPVDTEDNPDDTECPDILSMRTAKIVDWYPDKVKVELYNDRKGKREQITVPKRTVSIVENPFFAVMNEPNSVLQRLIRKLNMLDSIDEQSASGKLDLIIQLPYVIKSTQRRQQAEERRKDIEQQLSGSKYGIAYIDGTEHITQLNRAVENNLMKQIEYLTSMLYSQLGINQEILDGTASEETMINYYNRTIEPIVSAVVDEMKRKFLSKTARSRGHSIMAFRDPLKLVPATKLADLADKLTRNEIVSSNEIRQAIGLTPSDDPAADELRNKNINQSNEQAKEFVDKTEQTENNVKKEESG